MDSESRDMDCGPEALVRRGFLLGPILMTLVAGFGLLPAQAYGQEQPAQATDGGEVTDEVLPTRLVFKLGDFSIRDRRPAANETPEIGMVVHLALSPEATEESLELLERWRHRIRDQVIVSLRIADTKDFSEPDLHRLCQIMLLRSNRMLGSNLIDEILITEFTFALKQ